MVYRKNVVFRKWRAGARLLADLLLFRMSENGWKLIQILFSFYKKIYIYEYNKNKFVLKSFGQFKYCSESPENKCLLNIVENSDAYLDIFITILDFFLNK